ncbi:MAG: ribonuclease J [Microgenomates group bacterium]
MEEKSLKIISLGGFGEVTQNMFVYETPKDILVVDCGVGFPEEDITGVDLIIPDISYLKNKEEKIRGIILSHGHEDHIGALPYILPQFSKRIPVYGPKWAIALSKLKCKEFGVLADFREFDEKTKISLGEFFLEFISVTHSIPDTYHLVINTPLGIVYHAADFKLDLTPVIGQATSQDKIKKVGQKGVLCLLSDCLRAEVAGFTPPENKLKKMFLEEMENCQGKFLVTTFSSNISRLKQAIEASLDYGRKIVLLGRSVKENVKLARQLKYLNFKESIFLSKKEIKKYPPEKLTLLVAGSQGQLGSALDKIVSGEEEEVKIEPGDKVIFSTDYIPGNEAAIYRLIDNIYRLGGEVVYQDIHSGVHVSGHGFQQDLAKLLKMVNPQYVIPIGGNFRHMVAYKRLALKEGFREKQILLPDKEEFVEFFPNNQVKISQKFTPKKVFVDAYGVGDVGEIVLRDRKILATEGIAVIFVLLNQETKRLIGEPEIISRGFVYIKKNLPLINQGKQKIISLIKKNQGKDVYFLRQKIEEEIERFFFEKTGRKPMIVVLIMEV